MHEFNVLCPHHIFLIIFSQDNATRWTEYFRPYYNYPRFATGRNKIGVSGLHCKQVIAGKGDTECLWTDSLQRNESPAFIWDASGELLVRMPSSGMSLKFVMSVEMFEKQFTVQVGERTTSLILYSESIFIALS